MLCVKPVSEDQHDPALVRFDKYQPTLPPSKIGSVIDADAQIADIRRDQFVADGRVPYPHDSNVDLRSHAMLVGIDRAP
jgi:hypothetical protein